MGRYLSFAVAILLATPSVAATQQFAEVTIKANDYAYIKTPTSIDAGPTAFSLQNAGKVLHEVVLLRAKPGITADSVARAWAAGVPPREIAGVPAGVLIAPPGMASSGRLLVELERGNTYILICNLSDGPNKPPHMTLGMFTSFVVK